MRKRFIPLVLVGFVAFIFVGGEVVKLLWNWLSPPLFGLPLLNFWQGLAPLALFRIFFGGFWMPGGGQRVDRCPRVERITDRMADRFAERWQTMSPEQRERFRQRVRERSGFDPGANENRAE